MPTALPKNLQQFVDRELASGRYQTEDDVMIAALRLLQRDEQETLAGIKEGLAEMERGEGTPLDEAIDEIRQRHNIPPDA